MAVWEKVGDLKKVRGNAFGALNGGGYARSSKREIFQD